MPYLLVLDDIISLNLLQNGILYFGVMLRQSSEVVGKSTFTQVKNLKRFSERGVALVTSVN